MNSNSKQYTLTIKQLTENTVHSTQYTLHSKTVSSKQYIISIPQKKNPAYGRHLISQPMQKVAPIPKRTEMDRKGVFIFIYLGECPKSSNNKNFEFFLLFSREATFFLNNLI